MIGTTHELSKKRAHDLKTGDNKVEHIRKQRNCNILLQKSIRLLVKEILNGNNFDIFGSLLYILSISIMSIYITIQSVILKTRPTKDICLLIQSISATLKTTNHSPSTTPPWNYSLVCSAKEPCLAIHLVHSDNMETIGHCFIPFIAAGLLLAPGQTINRKLQLKDNNKDDIGTIEFSVQYDKIRNYLGEMQFFDLQSKNLFQAKSFSQLNTNFTNQKTQNDYMLLYKGPCKSKNLFSCLDESTESEQFTTIERKYI